MTEQLEMYEYWEEDVDPRALTPQDMVKEFAFRTGQKADPLLYLDLIEEEQKEFWESHEDSNTLKELCDLVYVLYGYGNARGWDVDKAFLLVHENNMSRVIQEDGSVITRDDGKIMKNPNYTPVNLTEAL